LCSPYLAHLALEQNWNKKTAFNRVRISRFAERFSLTELELKILRLITEGLSNEEISAITRLARETIKGRLKSLFRKLEVKNRTEAAVLAVREGLE
jgi:DNA-binding CsgD family transcriptional regulator